MKNRTRNRPKIDLKSIKNLPKIGSGADLASETVFEPISVQFWLQLGAVLGAKLGPSWGNVGQKIDFWKFPKACKNDYDFQHLSGPSWYRFLERLWGPKSNQNRSKIGFKSDHEANAKVFKNIGRGGVFEDPRA